MWSLATPAALALLPVPLIVALVARPKRHGGALIVPEAIARRLEPTGLARLATTARALLPALLWVALVAALSGPRVVMPAPALPVSGRDLVLVIDLSGSMDKADFLIDGVPVRRLDAVKRMATDFVRRRAGDRVGLVVFGDRAYFASPPTHDVEAVARAMEEATIGISGRATAISEGLGLALKRLERSRAPSRVVVLLSDGVNNGGVVQPIDAAEFAGRLGIHIHTIALGVRDTSEADASQDAVDAGTLRAIAEASGGRTFRVRSTADLDEVGRELDTLEPGPLAERSRELHRELWVYPAGIALLLALAIGARARWA